MPPVPPSVAIFASRREERLLGAELCTKAPEDIQAKAKAEIEGKGAEAEAKANARPRAAQPPTKKEANVLLR